MGKLTLMTAICIGLATVVGMQARAQDAGQIADTAKSIHLPPARLKAFEGFFQFSREKDQVIQFTLQRDTLLAKLIWINLTVHLVPESDSSFHTVEPLEGRSIPIKFTRNNEGIFSQMFLVGQNLVWNRLKDYKPLVRTEIAHTPEQLKAFEGIYQGADKQLFIGIAQKDNKLMLHQYWNGEDVKFVPDSPAHFYCPDQLSLTLEFVRGADGSAIRMIAFGRDSWIRTKSLSLTPAMVKVYEGKYRLKEDPDDIIRITASGLNLTIRQLWDGKETVVSPKTNQFFFNQELGCLLTFDLDDSGGVIGAFVLGNDYFEKIKE
jgi:hypothetical protein